MFASAQLNRSNGHASTKNTYRRKANTKKESGLNLLDTDLLSLTNECHIGDGLLQEQDTNVTKNFHKFGQLFTQRT